MGTDDAANKDTDGHILGASAVARDESKWQSNVFAAPQINPTNRKVLNFNDKGREALFGDNQP
jgi:hypothetical protein